MANSDKDKSCPSVSDNVDLSTSSKLKHLVCHRNGEDKFLTYIGFILIHSSYPSNIEQVFYLLQ